MHAIEKKLKKAEAAYEGQKSGANALALFACYVLAGRTIDTDDIYLSKAYHIAVTAHQEDSLDIDVISALLQANILLENYESTHELIRQLEAHNSFFNKNFPLFHGQILYFNSIVQFKTEKSRAARKIQRNLELLYEKTELTPLLAYLGSMQKIVFGDVSLCAKMYYEAIRKGLKSVYFYLDVYLTLTEEKDYTPEMNELARNVIPWALNNGLPIDAILERLEKKTLIGVLFSLSTGHLSNIYALTGHTGAFQCLCQKLIFEGDTSAQALSHYLTALNNNLSLRGLENISIKAAFGNKCFDLPVHVAEEALKNPTEYGVRELAFLFGILISRNAEFSDDDIESVTKFGLWAVSKGMHGKDFNLIYKFLYDINPDNDKLCEIIFDELFKYEIEFEKQIPNKVHVYEYTKRGIYDYLVNENKTYVNSATDDFNCYFSGGDSEEYMIVSGYRVSKVFFINEAERLGLYENLYRKGFQNSNIIIALACCYIVKNELTKSDIDVLQIASNIEDISESYKLDICRRLAEHYSRQKQYSIAVHFYRTIGLDGINPEGASGALKTFSRTGYYDLAARLIVAKNAVIPDAEILEAIKALHEFSDSPETASMCYKLIMNGFCSVEALGVLMKSFKGTQEEWLQIGNKIDLLGFDVSQIYEKIIVDGIFTGSIGNACNEAFVRLYSKNKQNGVLPKYVYFCCYEVIKNGKTLPDGLVEILSEIYSEDDRDQILCFAIALNYIRSGRQDKMTVISEAAAYQEETGLLLPDFKRFQDKSFISSYIEKNTAFVYTGSAHKTVFLRYKTEETGAFAKKRAKYFRFGMYIAVLPVFYGERITYYFEEENGSETERETYVKTNMRIIEQFKDSYYAVNNAIIYEQMMKFEMVERLIEDKLASDEDFPIITL